MKKMNLKIKIMLIAMLALGMNALAQNEELSCSVQQIYLEPGGLYLVNWTAKGFIPELDKIEVQMSDENGSFENATDVTYRWVTIVGKQIGSDYEGSSIFDLLFASDGDKYRIRVICLSLSIVGSDNGVDITISGGLGCRKGINMVAIEEDEQFITNLIAGKTYDAWCGVCIPCDLVINERNHFCIQLSDNHGIFDSPLTIGEIESTDCSGEKLSITIPNNIPQGNQYRIRLVTTNPEMIGLFEDITITSVSTPDSPHLPNIRIYPNPTDGQLIIENGEWRMENVELFDVMGRKQKAEGRRVKGENVVVLDISHLPAGIYILKVDNERMKVVKR